MLKMIVTEAVVSKGYDGAPAIRFYDSEGGSQIANFRIGKRVYDSKAENNHRWLNFNVKAFGDACERIKRMKLKEGSYINLIARYDEETWTDKNTYEERSAAVLIVEEVEFSGGGSSQKNGQGSSASSAQGSAPAGQPAAPQSQQGSAQGQPPAQGQPQQWQQPQIPPPSTPMPENFTGYEGFGGDPNPFF